MSISKIRNFINKLWASHQIYTKVLLVLAAFFLMILSSSLIMKNTLTKKLLQNIEETMKDTQSIISQTLLRPEVSINFIADMIEVMYAHNEGFEAIKAFMVDCSSPEFKEKMSLLNYYSVYGYFDVYESFFDGGGWIATDDFIPKERPWYPAAIENGDKVAITPPYIDADSKTAVIAYARSMHDKDGKLLGVICLDVPIDYINQLITNKQITQNSYGVLVDEMLNVIAHPNEEYLGIHMGLIYNEILTLSLSAIEDINIAQYDINNYQGLKSILFGQKLDNGWYVCYIIPEKEYFVDLHDMIWIISLLGLTMAFVLSVILISIDLAKSRSDIASVEKSRFLANMSHELRTPLNVVMGLTDLLLEDENLSEHISENLQKVSNAGSTLLSIVNDILDFSKIESGKLELMFVQYHLSSLLNDIITLVITRLGEKPVAFRLNITDDLPSRLYGDDLRLKQIFNNLLSNAIKYTETGTIELTVRCTRKNGNGYMMEVIVSDTGIGIRENDLNKLFSDYSQVDTQANRKVEGTGLGLAISKRLVNMMGGEISATSEYGKGSVFHVHVQQGYVNDTPIGNTVAEKLRNFRYAEDKRTAGKKIERINLSKARVLVVDDSPTNLNVAEGLLRMYKMEVDCVMSGHAAIDAINSEKVKYNAIFMDHMMPEMDGIEAAVAIRALGTDYARKIPIIALTANAIQGTEEMFFQQGFQAFLSKPIDIKALDTVVRKWVGDEGQTESKSENDSSSEKKSEKTYSDDTKFWLGKI